MIRYVFVVAGPAFLFALTSCSKPTEPIKGHFQIDTVSTAELRLQVDTARTYVFGCFNPALNTDSVLTMLLTANFDVVSGYQPIDNLCEDLCGPGFLVELGTTNDRILQINYNKGYPYTFEKGLGRAACCRTWIHFTKLE
jgi:hypothetical protein